VSPPSRPPPAHDPALGRYAVGVGITVFAVLSQYFVPEEWPAARLLYGNLPGDLFVVYGIPIVGFSLLVGAAPLRRWRGGMSLAAREGLGWYGVLSLVALAVLIVLLIAYEIVDPSLIDLLNRPNPALTQAAGDPWAFVGFSFVIGAVEETIFRGWIFGFWQDRPGSWTTPATWTSVVFAGVHLYYGTTYGLASPLIFPSLFFAGFAFAAAYRYSNGNLVVPALLHGQMDASAYLFLVSKGASSAVHYTVIFAGVVIAVVVYLRARGTDSGGGAIGAIVRYVGSAPVTGGGPPPAGSLGAP
jgi:membrane protease YdiL (CAAX protease family)